MNCPYPTLSASPEGRACHVRRLTLDHPSRFPGHDKRAPPNGFSEGPACQVRRLTLDHPPRFSGHDKRAPPNGFLEGPACQVRYSTPDDPSQFTRVLVGAIHELPLPHVKRVSGGTRLSGPHSEGRACHVRRLTLDHPSRFPGHDKRAPPNDFSEGRACHVRRLRLDHPLPSGGD